MTTFEAIDKFCCLKRPKNITFDFRKSAPIYCPGKKGNFVGISIRHDSSPAQHRSITDVCWIERQKTLLTFILSMMCNLFFQNSDCFRRQLLQAKLTFRSGKYFSIYFVFCKTKSTWFILKIKNHVVVFIKDFDSNKCFTFALVW